MYHEKFGQLVTSLRNLKARTPDFQIQNLRRLASIMERSSKSAEIKPAYRKFFSMAANTLTGLADGIASGDATEQDIQGAIQEIDGWADTVQEMEKAPPSDRKNSLPVDFLEMMEKETDLTLKKYEAYKQLVPDMPTARIIGKLLPVVAVTEHFMIPQKLRELHLAQDNIFGYPVLQKQLVIGLKDSFIESELRNSMEEAAQMAIDRVKEQTGKKYVPLGKPMRRKGAVWFWMVNDLMLTKFNKATAGGAFRLNAWAFPFEPETFKPKDQKIREKLQPLWDPKKYQFEERKGRQLTPEEQRKVDLEFEARQADKRIFK
jgi:hypothetical protein